MPLSVPAPKPFKVRDLRTSGRFMVDDLYIDWYARHCGTTATAVYASLCRHAGKSQEAWPTIERLARQHDVSRPTVIKAIKALESWNIIQVDRERAEDTNRQKVNVYVLLDRSAWKPVEGVGDARSRVKNLYPEPGKENAQSRVNDVYCKETQGKETQSLATAKKAAAGEPWQEGDLTAYLETMDAGNPAMRLIADFLTLKDIGVARGKLRVGTKAQMQALIRRHLRAANQLVGAFPEPQLRRVLEVLADEAPFDWTLETALKYAAYTPDRLAEVMRGMQPKAARR